MVVVPLHARIMFDCFFPALRATDVGVIQNESAVDESHARLVVDAVLPVLTSSTCFPPPWRSPGC